MFLELKMVGVWVMCLWEQMGQPKRVNLIELGPGRGTLMADLVCGASKFKNFSKSFHIHLVECSPALQKFQHKNLKCVDEENADEDADKRTFRSLVGTHSCLVACYIGAGSFRIADNYHCTRVLGCSTSP